MFDLSRFWGKHGPGEYEPSRRHSALSHMIEVGCVAEALARRAPRVACRNALDLSPEQLGWWVALHDLGKISPGFQGKLPGERQRLEAHGLRWQDPVEKDHSCTTQAALISKFGAVGGPAIRALGAHHGSFHNLPRSGDGQSKYGTGAWVTARQEALATLAELFGVAPEPPVNLSVAGQLVLAGLTAVADWIGSDATSFGPEGDRPQTPEERLATARQAVDELLPELGLGAWTGWPAELPPADLGTLFGFAPNDLQQRVGELAERLDQPSCVIIEAPMGLGKTEAALLLADRLMHRLGHLGFYFALPTQATSNQMFGRIAEQYLARRLAGHHPADLHLLHGQAAFDETYEALLHRTERHVSPGDIQADDTDAAVRAATWFRGVKRGLLSPFAVGTVDQALLGVVQTRHAFVRLYGLADKVVILDEVHAYDAYTSELIERLLAWLADLKSSVVLLSATLPAAKRRALLQAYGGEPAEAEGEYPRLSHTAVGRRAEVIRVAAPSRPAVTLQAIAGATDSVLSELTERLADGGCAAWVRNTVGDAQAAYRAARERFGPDEVELLHARYPVAWRIERTKRVEDWFGKTGQRPRRKLLIATQVIEQSLDLDFDLLVSDVAPLDLMIQRLGRLHRHDRERPPGLTRPVLLWPAPDEGNGRPEFGGGRFVYDLSILLKSWLWLREHESLSGGAAIEAAVEAVYGEPGIEVPPQLAAWAEELAATAELGGQVKQVQADAIAVPGPAEKDPFRYTRLEADPEDCPRVQRGLTRLGDPTLTIVCAIDDGDAGLVRLVDGGPPLPLTATPDRAAEKRLVGSSVSVALRGATRRLRDLDRPWPRSSVLGQARLIRFRDGLYDKDGVRLRLDREEGLVSEKT